MKILPEKSIKGLYWIILVLAIMVFIMFANTYYGPNKQPLFGFTKKTTPAE